MYSESVHEPNVLMDLNDQHLGAKEKRLIVFLYSEGQIFTRIIADNSQNIKNLKTIA